MCSRIIFSSGQEVGSIRQFQDTFNVDAKDYGFDGNEDFLDCCMCELDLDMFFSKNPKHNFYYDNGEWWEEDLKHNN